jgi:hypothetical protein
MMGQMDNPPTTIGDPLGQPKVNRAVHVIPFYALTTLTLRPTITGARRKRTREGASLDVADVPSASPEAGMALVAEVDFLCLIRSFSCTPAVTCPRGLCVDHRILLSKASHAGEPSMAAETGPAEAASAQPAGPSGEMNGCIISHVRKLRCTNLHSSVRMWH